MFWKFHFIRSSLTTRIIIVSSFYAINHWHRGSNVISSDIDLSPAAFPYCLFSLQVTIPNHSQGASLHIHSNMLVVYVFGDFPSTSSAFAEGLQNLCVWKVERDLCIAWKFHESQVDDLWKESFPSVWPQHVSWGIKHLQFRRRSIEWKSWFIKERSR